MELGHARKLYEKAIAETTLNPADWPLEFDKSKKRFGGCRYIMVRNLDGKRVASGKGRITLSRHLVELNDEKTVDNTIRHELAHAIAGRDAGHDWKWRAIAIKLGCDGKRCYSGKDVETPQGNFEARCTKCGTTFKKSRPPKAGRRLWCKCNAYGRKPENALVWKATHTPAAEIVNDPVLAKVLTLRSEGLGFVEIDKRFGIVGKKGWWSWKLVNDAKKKGGSQKSDSGV